MFCPDYNPLGSLVGVVGVDPGFKRGGLLRHQLAAPIGLQRGRMDRLPRLAVGRGLDPRGRAHGDDAGGHSATRP